MSSRAVNKISRALGNASSRSPHLTTYSVEFFRGPIFQNYVNIFKMGKLRMTSFELMQPKAEILF